MELYQLKTFVTVAEEGHLTRASERLFISQPSVSAHIKALEEELGVALFERTPKGMKLTPEGLALKTQADKILSSVEDMQHTAASLGRHLSGILRLGLHIDPKYLKIVKLFSMMRSEYPDIRLHLRQNMSWEVMHEIRNGSLDAGFVYGENRFEEISAICLSEFPLRIVGPVAWKERLSNAGWEDIAAMPWICPPPQCPLTKVAAIVFSERKLNPSKIAIADQESVLNELVSSGVGLSVMIEEEALSSQEQGRIVIWESSVGNIPLFFVHSAKREKDPLIQALRQVIRKIWADS